MFLIDEERVGHTADVVNVDQLPFGGFGGQEPLDEVTALVNEYVPRPTEVPLLSVTDYLAAGLDLEAKSRLLSQLNNHFGLYLYGKQIVDGEKPFWDGSDP